MKSIFLGISVAFALLVGSLSPAFAESRDYEILYCWGGNTECEAQFLVLTLDVKGDNVFGLTLRYVKGAKNFTLFQFSKAEFKKKFSIRPGKGGALLIETRETVRPLVEQFSHGFGDSPIKRSHEYDITVELNQDGSGKLDVPNQTEQEMSISGEFFPNLMTVDGIIQQEFTLPEMTVSFPGAELSRQRYLENTVTFETALREALLSFLEDSEDTESPLALAMEETESEEDAQRVLRKLLNNSTTRLTIVPMNETAEGGESPKDFWIFSLSIPGQSDHGHWAVIDRKGKKKTYNYGFN